MITAALIDTAGALLAGMLLCAGMAKIAVPSHLARAITGLAPALSDRSIPVARLVGVAEAGVALALSIPVTRAVGVIFGIALGVLFAAAGAIAAMRGLDSPCGCFGRPGGRPLGIRNVVFGIAVVGFSLALLGDGTGGWAASDGLPMLGTAAVAVLLTGWLYRDMIKDLFRPLRSTG